MALPDFFVIGAPKAGTTAVHAALAAPPAAVPLAGQGAEVLPRRRRAVRPDPRPRRRPQRAGVGLGARPLRGAVRRRPGGHADAVRAPPSTSTTRLRTTASTRWSRDAKLIAVVRDPIDRAYSNWMHLWSDGLEPIADFEAACAAECDRITAGWGLFWHYRRLGLYGEQLEHLLDVLPAGAGARRCATASSSTDPQESLDRDLRVPRDRPPAVDRGARREHPTLRAPRTEDRALAPVIRAGASRRSLTSRRRCGARPASRCSGRCTRTARRVHRWPPTPGARSSTTTPTTSAVCRPSPVTTTPTGSAIRARASTPCAGRGRRRSA